MKTKKNKVYHCVFPVAKLKMVPQKLFYRKSQMAPFAIFC